MTLLEKKFKCDLCSFEATRKDIIKYHLNSTHRLEEIACKICKKVYQNVFKMRHHMLIHRTQRFECPICVSDFKHYGKLQEHVESSHPEKKSEIICTCDVCGITYYSKLQLNKHMRIDHTGPFKCFDKSCFKWFSGAVVRNNHFMSFHSRDIKVS